MHVEMPASFSPRQHWANHYANRFVVLSGGCADHESVYLRGLELYAEHAAEVPESFANRAYAAAVSHPIVKSAMLELARRPHAPAGDILDIAMSHYFDSDPNFEVSGPWHGEYDDYLDPRSPFALLVRDALAPGAFHEEEWDVFCFAQADDEDAKTADRLAGHWQDVVKAYGRRYRLWGLR